MRMTKGEQAFQIAAVALIGLLSLSVLYPFVHLLSVSFSTPTEAIRPGFHLYPLHVSLEAYKKTFDSKQIWIGFGNTAFRTVAGSLLSLFFMAITAYPLSKPDLPHRSLYTMVFVFTMFFQGGLIPTYLLVKNIGLLDSRWVFILAPPFLISTFSLLIMRNFFMSLPSELEDAAKIDGAGDLRVLFSVIMPLSKPILATLGLWAAVAHWNSWFDGMLYIQDSSKMLLQTYLRRLIVENRDQDVQALLDQTMGAQDVIPETVKASTLIVTIVPIIIVYPFLQKYFVKGVLVGSLKG
ncbi:carbohydrate ABC transporter permease [Paenibacillus lycopersici]|uniref:Carbohydrate ABC transporter permease n=1 Tax=Paenibacillus lycopersici TaxID=2704462 RepID=A0A6C0G851_9BACL|nr:carbohydrate ABC transporter permease [Paenibacillus lycopersici]